MNITSIDRSYLPDMIPGESRFPTQQCVDFCREWVSSEVINWKLDGVFLVFFGAVGLFGFVLFHLIEGHVGDDFEEGVRLMKYISIVLSMLFLFLFLVWYRFFSVPGV